MCIKIVIEYYYRRIIIINIIILLLVFLVLRLHSILTNGLLYPCLVLLYYLALFVPKCHSDMCCWLFGGDVVVVKWYNGILYVHSILYHCFL